MQVEVTTSDVKLDGTWRNVPFVMIRKSEFDAFMEAHKDLLECAEDAVYEEAESPYHDNLSEAIYAVQKLERGEQ